MPILLPHAQPPAALPKRMALSEEPGAWMIHWKWSRANSTAAGALVLLWACAASYLVVRMLTWGMSARSFVGAAAVICGLTAHFTLAQLLNRSTLRIGGDRLTLTHGPVPCGARSRELPVPRIARIAMKPSARSRRSPLSWEVHAWVDPGLRAYRLADALSLDEAVYLVHQLRHRLGLPVEEG